MSFRAPHGARQIGLSVRSPWLPRLPDLDLDLVEVVADQWLDRPVEALDPVRELRVPVVVHALGFNVGSTDGLDPEYIDRVGALAHSLKAQCVSDHFAWRSIDGAWSATFLPLPIRSEVIVHVASRAAAIGDRIGLPLALETPSQYVALEGEGDISEALLALYELTGTRALVDACNLRVSEANTNHHSDRYHAPRTALEIAHRLAPIAAYVHVAGFSRGPRRCLDDHGSAPELSTLRVADRVGAPIILEWDKNQPDFDELKSTLEVLKTAPLAPGPEVEEEEKTQPERTAEVELPFDLTTWQRETMAKIRNPNHTAWEAFREEQIFSALATLEEAFPITRNALGPNFRWFVREMVMAQTHANTDVHGRTWIASFAAFLHDRAELQGHPRLGEMRSEWTRLEGQGDTIQPA